MIICTVLDIFCNNGLNYAIIFSAPFRAMKEGFLHCLSMCSVWHTEISVTIPPKIFLQSNYLDVESTFGTEFCHLLILAVQIVLLKPPQLCAQNHFLSHRVECSILLRSLWFELSYLL